MSENISPASSTSPEASVSHQVIQEIADVEDIDVVELDPLSESVDLDALESLVASADDDLRIQGTIHGHRIEVDGTGAVRVM